MFNNIFLILAGFPDILSSSISLTPSDLSHWCFRQQVLRDIRDIFGFIYSLQFVTLSFQLTRSILLQSHMSKMFGLSLSANGNVHVLLYIETLLHIVLFIIVFFKSRSSLPLPVSKTFSYSRRPSSWIILTDCFGTCVTEDI